MMTTFEASMPTFTVAPDQTCAYQRHVYMYRFMYVCVYIFDRRDGETFMMKEGGEIQAERDARTVGLLTSNAVNVDDELLTVHLQDLSVSVLESTTYYGNFVVLADWQGAHLRSLLPSLHKLIIN